MNAKQEFIKHTELNNILCATISCCVLDDKNVNLKVDYSPEDLKNFLEELDFDYDSGYGLQELYGTIWYTNGDWSTRCEYDGMEWWYYNSRPEVPEELH